MMADADLSLLSFLKTCYPLVPTTTVLKVMNKYENDQEKCIQALDSEAGKRLNAPNKPSLSVSSNSNNNVESPHEGKTIMARIKELHVSHEGSLQSKIPNQERHVSTIERSVGNASGPPEQTKRPFVNQSMSWTMQTPERKSASGTQTSTSQTSTSNMTTPQSAPPDFSSFFSRSATDIPNINCRTHGTSGFESPESVLHGSRPQQIPLNLLSTSINPMEQRHPVKVINIPAGSSSGGSVSSAATQPNPRHIQMNFGDSGGTCTITPNVMHRYRSTPNVSQNYRSEIHTEAPTTQSVHSSSIVLNTSNHLAPDRKLNINFGVNGSPGSGRQTPIPPPLSLNTDVLLSSGPNNAYSSGKLSTPIQASSPGIAHSKPVFVEITSDRLSGDYQGHAGYNGTNYSSNFNPGASVRPPPLSSNFFPHQRGVMFGAQSNPMIYNSQFSQDFPSTAGFRLNQHQNEYLYHNSQQQQQPDFHSPPSNFQLPTRTGYGPSLYSQFSTPTSLTGYPLIPGYFPGQTPSGFSHYTHYSPNIGQSSGIHMSKNPIVGQHSLGSRSSSQDSDHNMSIEYDARNPPYNILDHVSDSLSGRTEGVDSSIPARSGSMQDETEYVRALTQHQKRQLQKLLEEVNHHRVILNKLRSEVCILEKNMIDINHVSRSFPSIEDISGLCENNRRLQTNIQLYMNEIEMYKNGQTPVNKISPLDQQNFFENMPTGQQNPIYSISPDDLRSQSPTLIPPPRPPPPIPVRQRSTDSRYASGGALAGSDIFRVPPVPPTQPIINSGDSEDGESWSCSACTFSNHPALKKCEMCEMPRVMPPHPASSLGPPAATSHESLSSVPPRLTPGHGLVGNMHPRSGSPHSAVGHLPRAGI